LAKLAICYLSNSSYETQSPSDAWMHTNEGRRLVVDIQGNWLPWGLCIASLSWLMITMKHQTSGGQTDNSMANLEEQSKNQRRTGAAVGRLSVTMHQPPTQAKVALFEMHIDWEPNVLLYVIQKREVL